MSNDTLNLYHPPKPTLHSPNPRKGTLIIETPINLLLNTSLWAAQKHKNGTLFQPTTIPQGLDYWIVRNILSWILYVARKLGSEDPAVWGDTVTTLGLLGEYVEVDVWELKMTGRFGTLGSWLEAYLAYTTLGIHGGPLDRMRFFLLSKISGFLDDASIVLEVCDVVRLWDIFYTFPDRVCEEGEGVLGKTLGRIVGACEGNKEMEGYYVYGFRDCGKPDLLKMFLGVMIDGAGYPLPLKVAEEEIPGVEFGTIPELILEGESSNGLNWRNVEPTAGTFDEKRLHVDWRPTPRGSFYRDDVNMEDAPTPALDGVSTLVEEPITFLEDEFEGEEEWDGDWE
ncbi:hypothetical protein Vi05172_g1898 [Venturia inaequalis]|nr:hypothetical protein Vi05172_g1898 [Venturia inaequalis]